MSGASHAYRRVLRGELTPERYVAIVKRAVDMRMASRDDRRFAARLSAAWFTREDLRRDTLRPGEQAQGEKPCPNRNRRVCGCGDNCALGFEDRP